MECFVGVIEVIVFESCGNVGIDFVCVDINIKVEVIYFCLVCMCMVF